MGRLSRSIVCFLWVGLLVSVAVESREIKATITVGGLNSSSRERPIADLHLDPFQSSKRRVPNGADPIHNRGVGKSGRPPGKA